MMWHENKINELQAEIKVQWEVIKVIICWLESTGVNFRKELIQKLTDDGFYDIKEVSIK